MYAIYIIYKYKVKAREREEDTHTEKHRLFHPFTYSINGHKDQDLTR